MSRLRPIRGARREQAGYALLMIMFFTTALLISAAIIVPSVLTEGRRQKEDELIWRGQQYARAVKLYYRKNGRFPQSIEDLAKPKNDLRFLRKAYPDPINKEDGSWRLIYVGPGGQLIGSVKQQALIQLPGQARPAVGGLAGAATPPDAGRQPGELPAQTPPKTPAQQPPPPVAPAPGVEGKVFGGNIIGVGSKVNRASLKIYDGGATYREWEFIWDPTKDAVAIGQPAQQLQPPTGAPQPAAPQPPMPPRPPQ